MPDYTVSSTTDTQEAVNQAAGAASQQEEPKPVEEKPELEAKETEQEKPEAEKHATPRSVEKRIGKLTAEKYRLANENTTLREQLAALQAQSQTTQTAEPTPAQQQQVREEADVSKAGLAEYSKSTGKQIQDFESYEDFVFAAAAWTAQNEVKKTLKSLERAEKEAQQQEDTNEVITNWNERVHAFREEHPDYDQIVNNPKANVPDAAQLAIVEMENGPEVAYYLGQHLDICKELMAMRPARAAAYVGRIQATLEGDARPGAQGRKTMADKPPVSSAPPPIRTLSGSSTKSTKSLDELDYQEYRRIRDQQEKNRYAR